MRQDPSITRPRTTHSILGFCGVWRTVVSIWRRPWMSWTGRPAGR